MEGMALEVVGSGAEVDGPAVEKHDSDVDAPVARGDRAVAEAVEVSLVELREVELRLAVLGRARPGSGPRLGRHAEVDVAPGGLGLELLPAPEPDEVVTVVLE